LPDDSDEEKSSKQDFILACVLVSEYLSEKKKDQHFTAEKGLSGENTLQHWL